MSQQKLKSNLTKSIWTMTTSIKDTVSRNLLKAVSNKEITVPREHYQKMLYVVQLSIDSAFESSLKEYQKDIDKFLSEYEESNKKK